jgi:hypothetical protein
VLPGSTVHHLSSRPWKWKVQYKYDLLCVPLLDFNSTRSLCGQDAGAVVDRKPAAAVVSPEKKAEVGSGAAPPAPLPAADAKSRVLVGVMRVGLLAKQLLLR